MTEETKYETKKDEMSMKKIVHGLAAIVTGGIIIGSLMGCVPVPYRPGPGYHHAPVHRHAPVYRHTPAHRHAPVYRHR